MAEFEIKNGRIVYIYIGIYEYFLYSHDKKLKVMTNSEMWTSLDIMLMTGMHNIFVSLFYSSVSSIEYIAVNCRIYGNN